MHVDPLVTSTWLETHLHDSGVRVVDMRGHVITQQREPGVESADYRGARDEYLAGHIPGAVYVDWTSDIVDPDDPVPVQIAGPDRFAEAMGSRGIDNDTHVVAVDHTGGQFAARLWWALHYYGHERVSVLDGGWKRWVDEDRPVDAGEVRVARRTFAARPLRQWRRCAEQVRDELGDPKTQLIDARDAGQFLGTRRRGPRGGHIPGAISLPRELFQGEQGSFLPLDVIRERIASVKLSPEKTIVAYCNGGVAATVALFHLYRLGFTRLANYDGSWNEWGARPDLPVEV